MVQARDSRNQAFVAEDVHVGGERLGDVAVAEPLAHHRAVPPLHQRVVVGAPGAGLGEAVHMQLVEQLGHPVVDVLGAGASLRDALSAWNPLIAKGKASISRVTCARDSPVALPRYARSSPFAARPEPWYPNRTSARRMKSYADPRSASLMSTGPLPSTKARTSSNVLIRSV